MNTNGMRVPMTARKNFSFKGTLVRAGKVFDAGHQDKARELYKTGDAVYGDASGDLSILAMQQPEAVAARPLFTPQVIPQRTVAMVRTVNPEAPVEQVATDKSPEPIAPEGAAQTATDNVTNTTETAAADTATADTATTETGASDKDADTAAVTDAKTADKVEEPAKLPETPTAKPVASSVKKVAARKR